MSEIKTSGQIDAFLLGYIFGAAGQCFECSEEDIDPDHETEESKQAFFLMEDIEPKNRAALWYLAENAIPKPSSSEASSDIHFRRKDIVRASESTAAEYIEKSPRNIEIIDGTL